MGTEVLYWQGGNSELRLERSTTSTLGIDLKPVPDLSLGLTYFDITDRGRIDQLLLSKNSLTDPTFLGSIIWNPTPGQRQQVCAHSTFYGSASECLTAPINAIVDLRAQNLDALKTRGLDMSGRYQLDSGFGRFDLGVNATYLFEYSQARGPKAAPIELLNTEHEPIDWRARGKVSWIRGPFTTSAFVNFTDSYREIASTPSRTVHSWTTVDLNLEYAPGPESPSWLQGTTFGISAQNAFDAQAPFLNNVAVGIGYDQENANLLGRVLGFRIRHKW
jgi:iron complex outermembrane receptor protein